MVQSDFIFYYPAPVWDKRKEQQPLGGTWLSLINLTRGLARKGCKVIVFSDCAGKEETTLDNLIYIPIKKFNASQFFTKIFVSGRVIKLDWENINADNKFLWSHDNVIPDPSDYFKKGLDKIIVESFFHRQLFLDQFPLVSPEKYTVIFSPIDVDSYPLEETKIPYKGIYLSHPSRGLTILLNIISKIRKKIPEFYVEVFSSLLPYSYFNVEESDKRMSNVIKRLKETHGVVWHRSVPQSYLIKAISSSCFHIYPTEFHEIFCYAALQSCMCKTPPITTNTGVFPEWHELSDAFYLVNKDKKNWENDFIETVIKAYSDEKLRLKKANKARQFIIENFHVAKIANRWIKFLEEK